MLDVESFISALAAKATTNKDLEQYSDETIVGI